jgi:hypothetical protein
MLSPSASTTGKKHKLGGSTEDDFISSLDSSSKNKKRKDRQVDEDDGVLPVAFKKDNKSKNCKKPNCKNPLFLQ